MLRVLGILGALDPRRYVTAVEKGLAAELETKARADAKAATEEAIAEGCSHRATAGTAGESAVLPAASYAESYGSIPHRIPRWHLGEVGS